MKLLVVESTGKASKMLEVLRKAGVDSEWEVISCEGHYAGLSPKSLSFNQKKNFAPSWKSRNLKVLKRVQAAIEGADEVYAATDNGAEGEAIAFQISITAERAEKPFHRIRLRSLTAGAFTSADPQPLNLSLFNSWLARQLVNRLVRFQLSPVLEKRLGATTIERIPALILTELAKRERKVRRFEVHEGWTVRALLSNGSVATSRMFATEEEAEDLVRRATTVEPGYHSAMEKQPPKKPFTTSTLLQFLSDRYGFLPSHSMHMCETLYGLGYITFPYTTSTTYESEFASAAAAYVSTNLDEDLVSEEAPLHVGEGAEAIRPLDVSIEPSRSKIRGDMRTVYQAIWFNSIASQGNDALIEKQECSYGFFNSTDIVLSAKGTRLVAPEWHQLSGRLFLDQDQELFEEGLSIVEASSVFTKEAAPSHHTAATLIEWLDECTVGRPSNYARSISSLVDAGYAEVSHGRISITPQGEAVLTFIRKAVPDLIDPDFHAEVEEDIDSVLEGVTSFEKFAQDYWTWTQVAADNIAKSSLKPRILAPGGSKTRVWVQPTGVVAFSRKEDWEVPVYFDSKGRIAAQDRAE